MLTGGGSGIGKAAYSGCEAVYVARHPKKALNWCSVRVAAPGPQAGDVISWNRRHLREVRPDGSRASEAPTWDELDELEESVAELPCPPPSLLPQLPPPLRGGMAGTRCLLVLFDLEVYNWQLGRPAAAFVGECAATALWRDAAGDWGVPATGGRFLELGAPDGGSRKALSREGTARLCAWLQALSARAGGAQLVLLAHNGSDHDWPHLRQHLDARGLALPRCVGALGDTKNLFLAEKRLALQSADGKQWWSMERIYRCRFGREAMTKDDKIPDAHQAAGDVAAMERIFHDVCLKHDAQWVEDEVRRCAAAGWPHLAALQRRRSAVAEEAEARSPSGTTPPDPVAPATPAPRRPGGA